MTATTHHRHQLLTNPTAATPMVSGAVADAGGGWHQWWLAVVGGSSGCKRWWVGGVGGNSGVGLQ